MELLEKSFRADRCVLDLEASGLDDALAKIADELTRRGILTPDQRDPLVSQLLQRERSAATAIGQAVAVPHAYSEVLTEPLVAFARLSHPINAGALDGVGVSYVFMLVGPEKAARQHIDTLAAIARLMSDSEARYELRHAKDATDLAEAFLHFKARVAPSEEPRETDFHKDEMHWTGRFAGGLRDDLRRRLPSYVSDFRDGLHAKSIASIMFLFFACLAPTVTFGGIIGVATHGQIGAVETILATAIGGILYALFSGQPLNIIGTTGPLLVFITTLYGLCVQLQLPFLPTYACVSLWAGGLTLLFAVTDASVLMRFFTRFTDEIFAALISLIYIYEAIASLARESQDINDVANPSHALLTLLLALGTLYLAMNLQAFRRSRFLFPWMRELLGDFGPTIALVAMSAVAIWLNNVQLAKLDIPSQFAPSLHEGRDWFVNPMDAPVWVWFASAIPGLLGAVLIYLDQNITARLVNSPDHRLQKGPAYHWDLGVIGILTAVFSLFGLPWLVAATVRSLNHVRSLADVEEVVTRSGDRRDRVIHVRETRLTGLAIHMGIGGSLIALSLLKMVPMAVLYGVFLFMGLVSMKGNQFLERLALFPMESSLYPQTHYMRRVPQRTVHLYTTLQITCLAVLWIIKSSAIAILFPLFITLLVPIRIVAGRFFKPEHLAALDAAETPNESSSSLPG
ncbi:PTS system mannose-specific EIIBCA component [Novipirellula galeiformis]|uniref:PTS system mannose-specific EIIBCA component n=1 Tax=Novipirellula galeiformis TaxID=2528004 RepID=A0A5C6CSK3_9BACT|nr:PTS sugar transporter subunit IIA [Novipirellula galeiformis]TWU26517.1 PTS system mannose-specific EIIBCA component [Novipirellula galeiformis]